ncbi:hypothetical protein MCOR07_006616 [Pyricularia oryzae]|nr:hypothetical protein MCOR31_009540 [Pyricularia oryzae]KAI6409111.1 hypothetical protein MCOR24_007306 [Pyricularia oryzae]KAI6618304.1 hypothetical protein MCOR07_006616 [Pyricularia oryzae]
MAYHPAIPEIEMEVDSSVETVITVALEGYDCWRVERPPPADRKEWPKIGEHTNTAGFDTLIKQLQAIFRGNMYPYSPARESSSCSISHPLPPARSFSTLRASQAMTAATHQHRDPLTRPGPTRGFCAAPQLHPALGHYLGCVVNGQSASCTWPSLTTGMTSSITSGTRRRTSARRAIEETAWTVCWRRLANLHAMVLAHKDISQSNIMSNAAGQALLIDLGACLTFGGQIDVGGQVAGWNGPGVDNGRSFVQSSAELDELAIEEIRTHRDEELEKKLGQAGVGKGDSIQ